MLPYSVQNMQPVLLVPLFRRNLVGLPYLAKWNYNHSHLLRLPYKFQRLSFGCLAQYFLYSMRMCKELFRPLQLGSIGHLSRHNNHLVFAHLSRLMDSRFVERRTSVEHNIHCHHILLKHMSQKEYYLNLH